MKSHTKPRPTDRLHSKPQIWIWSAILLSILICTAITWLHLRQQHLLGQTVNAMEDIRQSRIELAKGFLYTSLADNPALPYDREQGLALLEQAVASLEETIRQNNIDPANLEPAAAEAIVAFRQSILQFRERLADWNGNQAPQPMVDTDLRIAFFELERQANRIDFQVRQHLQQLSDRLGFEFAVTLGVATLLLTAICGAVFLAERSRNKLETAQQISIGKYQTLFENFPLGLTMTDHTGQIVETNRTVQKILGLSQEEHLQLHLGNPPWRIVRPDGSTIPATDLPGMQALKEKRLVENAEIGIVKNGDETLWLDVTAAPIPLEGYGVAIAYADITKRKQAEEALRKSETLYRTLFEYVPDGILVADLQSYYLDANPMMCKMLGYTRDELIGLHASDIVAPQEEQHIAPALMHLKVEPDYFREWQFRRKDGSIFSAELSVAKMPDNTLLAMARDMTERNELEEQLLQSQKMESIGRLAGGIAHDFNNLLMPIIGYVELGMKNLAPEDPLYSNLKQVQEAAHRAAGLTRQILAFSRKQVLEMQVLDINAVITGFKTMIQRLIGEDIEFNTGLYPALYRVKADIGQIEQVLLNLAVNAREAMPTGGKLTVETANTYLDEEQVKLHMGVQEPGQYAMLSVSDTGHGMDRATQKQIFEPFFTTKGREEGTGLGLSTVFGIVTQHGGNIRVHSEPGKGTTFKICLPQSEEGVRIDDTTVTESAVTHGTETILVVEDEEMVRTFVCETLETYGYQVLAAENPVAGLRQFRSAKEKIHLLLTDVIMPEMNGQELYQRIAADQPDIKVVYMSGYTDNVIIQHGISDENVNFLQKPFTIENLIQKINQVLS